MGRVRQAEAAIVTTDATVATTTETVAVSAPAIKASGASWRVVILAWGQLTTGTLTTAVTPRIRRGTAITDTLVGEANAENVKAAAGSTEAFMIMVSEDISEKEFLQYSFTLQQTGASANGTILQASILVMLL